ncbi:MAG: alanyl-tRNA editing protein [Pseudomonadota bacterium]|nr:alanyl-tRNA editing protein [Pseudomonadota bacterium]
MTIKLYTDDAYLTSNDSIVESLKDNEVVLESTVFYPVGGGQPGDTGALSWENKQAEVINTYCDESGSIRHILSEDSALPAIGQKITASIDWERRYMHMRMHTGLHLLGSILQYGVTGGNISSVKSRLDFDMEETVDKEAVSAKLQQLIAEDHPISSIWITPETLKEQPELVRTMSVKPPETNENIRLLKIGDIDLQPCGGTHLKSTIEVGKIKIGKVEKKGKRNRRVNIELLD